MVILRTLPTFILKHLSITENTRKIETVSKKPLFLVLSYRGPLSLQTRTKLKKKYLGLYLRVRTNYQTLIVLKTAFKKNVYLMSITNFSMNSAINHTMVNV